MTYPEHIKMNKGVGLMLEVHGWDAEYIYKLIREVDKNLRNPDLDPFWRNNNWNDTAEAVVRWMSKLGKRLVCSIPETYAPKLSVTYYKTESRPWTHKADLSLSISFRREDEYWEDVQIHYPIVRAVLEKEKDKNGKETIFITFYDKDGNVTVKIKGARGYSFRCKAGEYILDESLVKVKKKDTNGGCFYCNNAEYIKENGIIYLACTKYNGKVAEVEYDGEQYPEYCKKR